ncbi:hypothetical protein ZEAMMB73_Zm00001d053250 [Zea mays]|uniref:Uncharacterized protein n=1 Tax=Zea mays TaxID=4577 RepID=A0A1D6QN21_MAIZE|nr:hypothetical protein ZEAMMB73_Zm00001d053250 [Zea mays]
MKLHLIETDYYAYMSTPMSFTGSAPAVSGGIWIGSASGIRICDAETVKVMMKNQQNCSMIGKLVSEVGLWANQEVEQSCAYLVAAAIHQMPRSSLGPSSARSITRWPRREAIGGAGSPQGTGFGCALPHHLGVHLYTHVLYKDLRSRRTQQARWMYS